MVDPRSLETSQVALDRDRFLRRLLRELSGSLQDVVGLEEAEGFISVVGQAIGEEINGLYCRALEVDHLDRAAVSAVLVDLKRRIEGDFHVISETADRIVLGNRACPFGDQVAGRPALCMMTSNVFGHIAAENLGYARVTIDEAIARGHAGCRVTIHLRPEDGEVGAETREYFKRAHA